MQLSEVETKYPDYFPGGCGYGCGDGWVPAIARACHLIQWKISHLSVPYWDAQEQKQLYLPLPDKLIRFKFDQIKEKFGGLRAYYHLEVGYHGNPDVAFPGKEALKPEDFDAVMNDTSSFISGAINLLELLCNDICEDTGAPGVQCQRKGGGWYRTLSLARAEEIGFEPCK